MAELDIRWEKINSLRLDNEELRILKKLLGSLSCVKAEQQLGLTPKEYEITYNIFSTIDNQEGS